MRLEERGLVSRSEGTGAYNADEFSTDASADEIDAVELDANLDDPSEVLTDTTAVADATNEVNPRTTTYYSLSMRSFAGSEAAGSDDTARADVADDDSTDHSDAGDGAGGGTFAETWSDDD